MRNARKTRRRGVTIGLGAGLLTMLIALVIAGCGGGDSSTSSGTSEGSGTSENASNEGGEGGKLSVVGYSTPESVYAEALEPAFEKTPEGSGVSFSNSFGASGDQ